MFSTYFRYFDDVYVRAAIVVAFLTCLFSSIFYVYFFTPRITQETELRSILSKSKSEYSFRKTLSENSTGLNEYLSAAEEINKKFEKELRSSEVIFQLADLFSNNSIQVTGENYSSLQTKDDYFYIDADLKIKGSYQEIQNAMQALEGLTFAIFILKVSLIKEEEYVIAEIQARIFSYRG